MTLIFIGALIDMFDKAVIKKFLSRGFSLFVLLIIFLAGLFVFQAKRDVDRDLAAICESVQNRSEDIDCHPPVTSSEDFHGEKTNFSFSPDKKYIAFIQYVFNEYGEDWDKYWALKLFNPKTNAEKILFIDSYKMSQYSWLDNDNIRVFHSGGTGVRIYIDISVNEKLSIFSKNFKEGEGWLPDENYAMEAKNFQEAWRLYHELNGSR